MRSINTISIALAASLALLAVPGWAQPPDPALGATSAPRGDADEAVRKGIGCGSAEAPGGVPPTLLAGEAPEKVLRALYGLYEFYAAAAAPRFELSRIETFDVAALHRHAPPLPTLGDGFGVSSTVAHRNWRRSGTETVRQAWLEARWERLQPPPAGLLGFRDLAAARDIEEPIAFTTYGVRVEMAGASRSYDAALAWYRCPGSDRVAFSVLDFVTQGLDAVARLDAPRADDVPWPERAALNGS